MKSKIMCGQCGGLDFCIVISETAGKDIAIVCNNCGKRLGRVQEIKEGDTTP